MDSADWPAPRDSLSLLSSTRQKDHTGDSGQILLHQSEIKTIPHLPTGQSQGDFSQLRFTLPRYLQVSVKLTKVSMVNSSVCVGWGNVAT